MAKRTLQVVGRTCFSFAIVFLLTFLAGVMMAGCGGPRTYIHPMGISAVRKIVVMPVGNLSNDDKAGDRVRMTFVIELLKTDSFDVIDIGEADRLLGIANLSYGGGNGIPGALAIGISKDGGEEADTSIPISKKIGDALNVQAIFVSSVDTYSSERVRDESVPEVTISARLIDAETGIIMWASTHTRRGSPGIPILGWLRMTSLSLVSRQVVEDMAKDLAQYVLEE